MKVEVNNELEPKVIPFPKPMISKEGLVVFFIEEKKGVLISDPENEYPNLGVHYAANWAMEFFTDFKGSITITQ